MFAKRDAQSHLCFVNSSIPNTKDEKHENLANSEDNIIRTTGNRCHIGMKQWLLCTQWGVLVAK